MNIYRYPSQTELSALLERPAMDITALFDVVGDILKTVRQEGDASLRQYEERFDHAILSNLSVTEEEMVAAEHSVDEDLKVALQQAHSNIATFHEAQRFQPIKVTTCQGVTCRQKSVAIEKVGLYIPGGSAPLFSTVLMLATPARIAGCSQIVLCTPPRPDGSIHPAILYAARLCGVTHIFKVGGAQAIAAMTFGTESIPKVDKIFGPGNQYVMAAKQMATLYDVAIDMPAGPSEVAVIADHTADPSFVAADLLSQAEHGPDSQVILISDSEDLILAVNEEISRQIQNLPRRSIAEKALSHSVAILAHHLEEAVAISNQYAPEHLILSVADYPVWSERITCAGSVFEGRWSCESAGDYASGTNHTLPTKGYARSFGGLCLDSFMRKMTFQELSEEGILTIGKTVMAMAGQEGLEAHRNAMQVRYDKIKQIKE